MITVKTYLYPNTAEVQVFDPAIFTTRNRQVYSRPIKVYQGIDNPIQVIVLNQDQKKVNLTGSNVTASIQDPVNQVTVASYPVTWANIQLGQGHFTFDANTINSLEQRFYKLAFSTTVTSTHKSAPLYVDDNYGVPLDLEVLPAYYKTVATLPDNDTYSTDGGSI
jgi:ABC-type uncharacterized transport system permease subunit